MHVNNLPGVVAWQPRGRDSNPSPASVRCLRFHIISTEHSIITQAASQWVLCFSGSIPIYLWLIIFFVLFFENKYDDDDDDCTSDDLTLHKVSLWVAKPVVNTKIGRIKQHLRQRGRSTIWKVKVRHRTRRWVPFCQLQCCHPPKQPDSNAANDCVANDIEQTESVLIPWSASALPSPDPLVVLVPALVLVLHLRQLLPADLPAAQKGRLEALRVGLESSRVDPAVAAMLQHTSNKQHFIII